MIERLERQGPWIVLGALAAWLASVTRERLLAMARAARALRKAGAVERVADVCIELGAAR